MSTSSYGKTLESLKAAMELLALAKTLDDISPEDREVLDQIPVLAEQLEQRYEQLVSQAWARMVAQRREERSYADGPWSIDGPWSSDKSLEKPFYLTEL
jgi:hypothetical protein